MPVTPASKKAFPSPIEFEEEQTEAMNLSATPSSPKVVPHNDVAPAASPPSSKSPGNTHNPPIVLRIFKGTSQLVTPVEEPVAPTPAVTKATTPERKSRRRGHSTETAGNVSPKRLRERHKGVSYVESDPDSEFEYDVLSVLGGGTTKSHVEKKLKPAVVESEIPNSVVESEQAVNKFAQVENNNSISSTSEPTSILPPVPEPHPVAEVDSAQTVDTKKIEEGIELLASTYTDSNADEKHLLDTKANKSEKDVERDKLLAVLAGDDIDEQMEQHVEKDVLQQKQQSEGADTEWFSDSDCSDTVHTAVESDLVPSQSAADPQLLSKTPKKRSIFKSRQDGGDENAPARKKRFGLYKHKWSGCDGPPGAATPTQTRPEEPNINTLEEEFEEAEALTRVTSYPEPDADSMDAEAVTSIKCKKNIKGVRLKCN